MRKGFNWKFWRNLLFIFIFFSICIAAITAIKASVRGVIYKQLGVPVNPSGLTININK